MGKYNPQGERPVTGLVFQLRGKRRISAEQRPVVSALVYSLAKQKEWNILELRLFPKWMALLVKYDPMHSIQDVAFHFRGKLAPLVRDLEGQKGSGPIFFGEYLYYPSGELLSDDAMRRELLNAVD